MSIVLIEDITIFLFYTKYLAISTQVKIQNLFIINNYRNSSG